MGMYTEITVNCQLKQDTPKKIIKTLEYMCQPSKDTPQELPCDELFETERWWFLLTCSSAYFDTHKKPVIEKLSNGRYKLDTCSNIKNYDSEISKFFNWIAPYVFTGRKKKVFIGSSVYEEYRESPTNYYIEDGLLIT